MTSRRSKEQLFTAFLGFGAILSIVYLSEVQHETLEKVLEKEISWPEYFFKNRDLRVEALALKGLQSWPFKNQAPVAVPALRDIPDEAKTKIPF